jgi:hypothetical protein
MRKLFEIGGLCAAACLIAIGVAALVLGINGHNTVSSSLKPEQIVGTPDMTPAGIAPEVKQVEASLATLTAKNKAAGVAFTPTSVSVPSGSVAGKLINSGDRARTFAQYMRIHALGATGGLVYAQMGRFQAKPDAPLKFTDFQGGTSDSKYAVVDPTTKQPVDNGRRNLWVTETALTTALNASYMADRISLFGIVVGVAVLLSGIGFGVLAVGGALRNPETAIGFLRKPFTAAGGTPAVPTA